MPEKSSAQQKIESLKTREGIIRAMTKLLELFILLFSNMNSRSNTAQNHRMQMELRMRKLLRD